jgi:acyl-CoA synthetase (AMP-forming)/AMP-acid ligase II
MAELLFEAECAPDTVVVWFDDVARTRAELETQADALATALQACGVGPGQPVGVMLPNGPDVVAALFGVWRAHSVYVPINPRLADREVEHVLEDVRPAALVTTADLTARAGALPLVVAGTGGVAATWTVRGASGPPPWEPAVHEPDIAAVSFTSGTTGRPKPVLMRHSGIVKLMDGVIGTLRGGSSARSGPEAARRAPMPNLIPVSLSLWAGIYQVLFAFRVGAPVVLMNRFDTQRFADLVRRFEIRSTVLPPAAMTMLVDDADITDLAPLRYVRSISAPLSPLQARRFKSRFGIAVLNGWGQTEIGGEIVGWSAADSREFGETKLGSVGRPHEGVTVRAVDAGGADVGPDDAGELWVRTPALSAGYANRDAAAALSDRLSPDGWFRTGDVGRVDADGFVWIEGRVSDMINRGGLKVFPAEVAEVLLLSPAVAEAAVVGVPDDRLGEVPWAFVVAAAGQAVDPEALEALCREHLAPYKVPVAFRTVEALPRNEIGKLVAPDLVALAMQRG